MSTVSCIKCITVFATYLLAISDDDDEIELALSLLCLCNAILICYIKWSRNRSRGRGPYIKDRTQELCDSIIRRESTKIFKSHFRVNRATFWHLLNLIKDDPVFKSKGKKPQIPVKYQLATFLGRFGTDVGLTLAMRLGISEGSVYHTSARVVRAFRRLRPQYLSWPAAQSRQASKVRMQGLGFPGAVGIVDGTLIPLKNKPRRNPWSYWSRKKTYALAMQAVTDFDARFISFDLGWPGCTNNTTIWKMSHIWQHRSLYLAPDKWLMADKGYPISKFLMRPFSNNDLTNDPQVAQERRQWNKAFSSRQVTVEHAFGLLKGRFSALCYERPYRTKISASFTLGEIP